MSTIGRQIVVGLSLRFAQWRHRRSARREEQAFQKRWAQYEAGEITEEELHRGYELVSNPKCKVKGCYGTGRIGYELDGTPIPCKCCTMVYVGETVNKPVSS